MITDIVAWPRERLEQLSTRIAFFIAGFVMAAWAPLVPFAKARAAIDDGVLGLILLCLGIGSIVTMPLSGALAARFGCRLVIAASTVLLCLTLPLLATVASLPLLVAVVLVFGAGVGALDVAINIQAIIVERASGRPMMSGFHGQFSLGGIAGAAGVTALLGAGSSPLAATLCVSIADHRPVGDGSAASPAVRRETRGADIRRSARRRAVHRRPLFHRLPGGRRRTRLECRLPDLGARHGDVLRAGWATPPLP